MIGIYENNLVIYRITGLGSRSTYHVLLILYVYTYYDKILIKFKGKGSK